MSKPTESELDLFVTLFETGKELSEMFEKYDGDDDWIEWLRKTLAKTDVAETTIRAYATAQYKEGEKAGRIDELEKLLHKGTCEVMCRWSDKCDKKGQNCVPIRKRIAELQSPTTSEGSEV